MKKFLLAVGIIIALVISIDIAYYQYGFYIDLNNDQPVTTFVKTQDKTILMLEEDKWVDFEIKGVDMGPGKPGEWATEFAIDEDTYYRWFGQIQEMGANTVRIYTTQSDKFYNAYYRYNTMREEAGKKPLYLLHGVWVNDYVQHSHLDAYSDEFKKTFIDDCRTMIDIIHGRKKLSIGKKASAGSGTYKKDVSPWVIGYILGVEWESDVVVYTNQVYENSEKYSGDYFYADADATPFESMLAEVADKTLEYEADKYKCQKLMALSNWCTTDPFKYSVPITQFFNKLAFVNVEHIKTTDRVVSGHFASYHVYPYHPDYLAASTVEDILLKNGPLSAQKTNIYKYLEYKLENIDAPKIEDYLTVGDYVDDQNRYNTYLAYLTALNRYHTLPVIISEFGVSTGRGLAQIDSYTNRNQGHMSEKEQGIAVAECYRDIKRAGCAGSCIFSWQDEWFKRTWNTMYAINLLRTPYWSDYQTNEQYFGLLSFDPGREKSVCYVDKDMTEWSEEYVVAKNEDIVLSMKYDERFVYFLVNKPDFDLEQDSVYIPIDVTPKSGSMYCESLNLKFEEAADFVISINGRENSKILVQERYEVLRANYAEEVYGINTYEKGYIPDKSSSKFVDINLMLKLDTFESSVLDTNYFEVYPTGKLRYGNANPEAEDFNSLADFCHSGDFIEIKLPWQLLNFSDPSNMEIHDDYYDGNYGIEEIKIDKIGIGVGVGTNRIPMEYVKLKGWGNKPTYHERLKSSYYMLKELWNTENQE